MADINSEMDSYAIVDDTIDMGGIDEVPINFEQEIPQDLANETQVGSNETLTAEKTNNVNVANSEVKKSTRSNSSYRANTIVDNPNKSVPNNLKCEKAILSSILREPKPCVDIAIEHLGSNPEVFYSPVHRIIFDAILLLQKNAHSSSIDAIQIASLLEKNGKLDSIGGEVYLAELYGEVATTVNIEAWCEIVRSCYTLRQMIAVCSSSLQKCYNEDKTVDKIVDEIENDIYNIRNRETKNSVLEIKDCIVEQFKYLEALLKKEVELGISTGFPQVDDITGGLKKGEMFVLAARPSIGKTAIALNIVRQIALNDPIKKRKIAFFSLEMTAEQITRRLLCSEAWISETSFWRGTFNTSDWSKMTNAVSSYKNSKIFIDATGGISIAELRAKARRLKMMEDIDLIVIDYLQLMKADDRIDNRQQAVAEISSGIKQLAKDLDIPILILAQLNREVDKNASGNTKPKLSHLRESGAIEQDADIVAFLHRDREKAKQLKEHEFTDAIFIVEKNRNGRIAEVNLHFYPAVTRFEEAPRHKAEDGPA